MRTITFHANIDCNDTYCSAKEAIEDESIKSIHTNQLTFISFDLLDKFSNIMLVTDTNVYHLKLGQNTWIDKELRVAHNLLKLVTTHILEKI